MVTFKLRNQIIMTLFVLLFVFCSNLFAADMCKKAKLSWLPSPSSHVVGYKVYIGTSENGPFSKVEGVDPALDSNTGHIVCEVSELLCGSVYYFVATAYTSVGIESGISKVVDVDYSGDCIFESVVGVKTVVVE